MEDVSTARAALAIRLSLSFGEWKMSAHTHSNNQCLRVRITVRYDAVRMFDLLPGSSNLSLLIAEIINWLAE